MIVTIQHLFCHVKKSFKEEGKEEGVTSALIGVHRPEQVKENVKASGYVLSEATLDEIEKVLQ